MPGTNLSLPSTWTPPNTKLVKYGLVGAIVLGGVYTIKTVAPDMISAVTLVDTLLQDGTHLLWTGGTFLGTAWLFYEILAPGAMINKFIVRWLTNQAIQRNPMLPIDVQIDTVVADQNTFQQQFQTLDGVIGNLKEKVEDYHHQADQARKIAMAARAKGDNGTVDVQSTKYGLAMQTAGEYETTLSKIAPMADTFQRISQACDVMRQKLEYQRDVLRDKWTTGKATDMAVNAANRTLGLSKTAIFQMAHEAQDVINTQFGESLGHLANLKRTADPFLKSLDAENASYSADLFADVQDASTKLIASTGVPALPPPEQSLPWQSAAPSTADASLAGLIH